MMAPGQIRIIIRVIIIIIIRLGCRNPICELECPIASEWPGAP